MTILEFADIIDKNIIIKWHSNQNRFSAEFDDCWFKFGDTYKKYGIGNGFTPQGALNSYKDIISGKTLAFNFESETKNEQDFVVPELDDI
jgi:hypothetical protein